MSIQDEGWLHRMNRSTSNGKNKPSHLPKDVRKFTSMMGNEHLLKGYHDRAVVNFDLLVSIRRVRIKRLV